MKDHPSSKTTIYVNHRVVSQEGTTVLISYEFFSMIVLKVAQKSIGKRVNSSFKQIYEYN